MDVTTMILWLAIYLPISFGHWLNIDIQDTCKPRQIVRSGRRAGSPFIVQNITYDFYVRAFIASVDVGTPPQTLGLKIDTSLQVTILPARNSTDCIGSTDHEGCPKGQYDPFYSDTDVTFEADEKYWTFNFTKDGSDPKSNQTVEWSWLRDSLSIGEIRLPKFSMGLAEKTGGGVGFLGLGIPPMDSINLGMQFEGNLDSLTSIFSFWMTRNSSVVTTAYSIFPGLSGGSGPGHLMLGAIDIYKFEYPLISMESYMMWHILDPGLYLALTGVTARSNTGSDVLNSDLPIGVLVDLSRDYSYLPHNLAMEIFAVAGVVWNAENKIPVIPCRTQTSDATFDFMFGGPGGAVIKIPLASLIRSQTDYDLHLQDSSGQPLCIFQIRNQTDYPSMVIGNSILRWAYMVVDLVNRRVALAGLSDYWPAESSSVVPFSARGAGIPSATAAPSPPTRNALGPRPDEGWAVLPSITVSSPSLLTTYAAQAGFTDSTKWHPEWNSENSGLSKSETIGVGVGVAVAGLMFIVLGIWCFRRRKQYKSRTATEAATSESASSAESQPAELKSDATGVRSELGGRQVPSQLATGQDHAELSGDFTQHSSCHDSLSPSTHCYTVPQQVPSELDGSTNFAK